MIGVLAQTMTAEITGGVHTTGMTAQILALVGAGLVLLIPIIFKIVNSIVSSRGAVLVANADAAAARAQTDAMRAQTETVKAQTEALEAKVKLAEAQRLAEALTKGVEKVTASYRCDECEESPQPCATCLKQAKDTKTVFRAVAANMDVGQALEDTVTRLGFSQSKNTPENPAQEEGGPK